MQRSSSQYKSVGALLPQSGNKKRDFGLWVAGATHVSTLLPQSGNKKQEFWVVGFRGSPR
jgi:hypothetical protein